MIFYTQLKQLCEDKAIKLTPLVEELGMTTGNISRWKKGGYPSVEALLKFADYFNVSTDYLLGRTNNSEVNR
ncbi:MAG TPA: hypothetical protein DCM73_04415 [Clostridiales bacterium]|nr:hypothetical protein [Clostridiales bacterium]